MDDDKPPSEYLLTLIGTEEELKAVEKAVWQYLVFLRRFKAPTPEQSQTIQLLDLFQKRNFLDQGGIHNVR